MEEAITENELMGDNNKENNSASINKTKSLPRIASQLNLLSDDDANYNENTDNKYSNLKINPYPQKSKSFTHNHPYSTKQSMLARSKSRLIRSNTARNNIRNNRSSNRPNTSKFNGYKQPKYSNWGMKIDSSEALREQIYSLKKNYKKVCDENLLIKTEKRRMEKLLRKNDRKLKRLLNTVTEKNPKNNDGIANFVGDETRKYATTELLDQLNIAHNNNVSLKKKLVKAKDELETSQNIINHLEAQKTEIQSTHKLQYEPDGEHQQIIEHLENQLEEYKSEVMECHEIFDKLTKTNDESLQKLKEKEEQNSKLKKELKDLRQIVENEKFFNNKILDEITEFKTKNKDLEDQLTKQREIEAHSQVQVKKLSNKLFDIEEELKDRIEFYQIFEKICLTNDKFVDELIVKSQNENEEINALCSNLKLWLEQLQDEESDLHQNVQDAMKFLRQLFAKRPADKSGINGIKQSDENIESRILPEINNNDTESMMSINTMNAELMLEDVTLLQQKITTGQDRDLNQIDNNNHQENVESVTPYNDAVETPKKCIVTEADLKIVKFKSPEDTFKEVFENKKIQRSATLSDIVQSKHDDDASSMSLYDAVIEIQAMQSREVSEAI